jgi:hypothetical protein
MKKQLPIYLFALLLVSCTGGNKNKSIIEEKVGGGCLGIINDLMSKRIGTLEAIQSLNPEMHTKLSQAYVLDENIDKKWNEFFSKTQKIAAGEGSMDEKMKKEKAEIMAFVEVLKKEASAFWSDCTQASRPFVEKCLKLVNNKVEDPKYQECISEEYPKANMNDMIKKYDQFTPAIQKAMKEQVPGH